ncbi:hypothetical protein Ade02nite_08930 [Paractinoplanes deccanensis]|uniref:DUF3329 domain-containing protein n=1 Tax=Paractinoplanes deccanensis TaxID=113561 RepID=A0ABQ3XWY3_9ACTN|nr:hypothetical protein [Actinoplanes deccanensis]GID72252.1 hypothetical protein Ade02nite_08930 [Actinoplanes deccanensis]
MSDESGDEPRREGRRGPVQRLSAHRLLLALALVSTGWPLIVKYGWGGVAAAVVALAYAVYLIAGKRLPRWRRRRKQR